MAYDLFDNKVAVIVATLLPHRNLAEAGSFPAIITVTGN
jgi:hypothetical protein